MVGRRPTMPNQAVYAVAISAAVLAAATSIGGCQKPLFPEHEPRTQYERYQLLRGQYRPVSQQNPYGAKQPALRERLAPLEEPY